MGLADISLDLALGGSFRSTIVASADTVAGCWPLAEIATNTPRNIAHNNRYGTFYGPGGGAAAGLGLSHQFELPEGGLGILLTGLGDYMEVLDDSTGDYSPDLSCTDGPIDVLFLMRTSTNDATLRAIVQKWDGTNGWYVALESGTIRFALGSGGSSIFNFARGSIADGQEHLIHCIYNPSAGYARIYIDGVQSGASVTSVTTTPQATTANLRVGVFNTDTGPFNGYLSYVTVGSIGDPTLSATLQAARSWTSYTDYVRSSFGMQVQYGINGTSPLDRVASTGTLQCALDNRVPASTNVGYHSVGHANAAAGFGLGIPVRLAITYAGTTYYKFRGFLKSVTPTAGQRMSRESHILATDWMDVAAETPLTNLPTFIDRKSWECFGVVTDQADRPPVALSIAPDSDVFPYAFDNMGDFESRATSEYQRIAMSEMGWIFVKGNTQSGGQLTFQDRTVRQALPVSAQFDNTMSDLELTTDVGQMVNRAKVTFTPRELGTPGTALCSLESQYFIGGMTTVTIELPYKHPTDDDLQVGGTDFITTVPTTDYQMLISDGSLLDLTSDFDVRDEPSGNGCRFTIRSRGFLNAYIVKLQNRGTPIYFYDPVTVTYEDGDSVRRYGARTLEFDMPYQADNIDAEAAARFVVDARKDPISTVSRMSFVADKSPALMTQALAREVGDLIEVREAVATGSRYVRYYIQHVALDIDAAGVITCHWQLVPVSAVGTYWILDESLLGESTILGWD